MNAVSEELRREQQYFDNAAQHREQTRTDMMLAPAAAAHNGAAIRIRQDAQARLDRIGGPDEPGPFGRMDDEDGGTFYIGNHGNFDDDSEPLVIDWHTPAGAPF